MQPLEAAGDGPVHEATKSIFPSIRSLSTKIEAGSYDISQLVKALKPDSDLGNVHGTVGDVGESIMELIYL